MTDRLDALFGRWPAKLPSEVLGGIAGYLAVEGEEADSETRMIHAAREAMGDGLTDLDTIVGWAITYEQLQRWLRAEMVDEGHAFSYGMIADTRERLEAFATTAARHLRWKHDGELVLVILRLVLFGLGLRSDPPRTTGDFYQPIKDYLDIYLERRSRRSVS